MLDDANNSWVKNSVCEGEMLGKLKNIYQYIFIYRYLQDVTLLLLLLREFEDDGG